MARSIGDWFADHAGQLSDGAPDDEVLEHQAPWDLHATGMPTGGTEHRSARHKQSMQPARRTQSRRGRPEEHTASRTYPGGPPARTPNGVSASLRHAILVAIRESPGADDGSLAAALTRAGTPVRPEHIAAVRGARLSPIPMTVEKPPIIPLVGSRLAEAVRQVLRTDPGIGKKRLAEQLRARGIVATKRQLAVALAHLRTRYPGSRSSPTVRGSATERRSTAATARKTRAAMSLTEVPKRITKIKAEAQVSRTQHETPLCSSCGIRLSIYSACRCS